MKSNLSPYKRMAGRLDRGETIIMDGGMGTQLQRLGCQPDMPLWAARALLDCPEKVKTVHQQYARAGAAIHITNAYRANQRAFARAGIPEQWQSAVRDSVRLARGALREWPNAVVAGSLGCIEGDFDPGKAPPFVEALPEHTATARELVNAGADFLIAETMNKLEEALAALEAGRSTGMPVWVALACREDGRMHSGERVAHVACELEAGGAAALLINCSTVAATEAALKELLDVASVPVGAYPNLGHYQKPVWRFDRSVQPGEFAETLARWAEMGAQILGGCCGTGPREIRALRRAVE